MGLAALRVVASGFETLILRMLLRAVLLGRVALRMLLGSVALRMLLGCPAFRRVTGTTVLRWVVCLRMADRTMVDRTPVIVAVE